MLCDIFGSFCQPRHSRGKEFNVNKVIAAESSVRWRRDTWLSFYDLMEIFPFIVVSSEGDSKQDHYGKWLRRWGGIVIKSKAQRGVFFEWEQEEEQKQQHKLIKWGP